MAWASTSNSQVVHSFFWQLWERERRKDRACTIYTKVFRRLSWMDIKWASSCLISKSWISSLGTGNKSSWATNAAKLSFWVNLSVAVSIAWKQKHMAHVSSRKLHNCTIASWGRWFKTFYKTQKLLGSYTLDDNKPITLTLNYLPWCFMWDNYLGQEAASMDPKVLCLLHVPPSN